MIGRQKARAMVWLRMLIVMGAVFGMPLLAVPSVARFADRLLYAPADRIGAADAYVDQGGRPAPAGLGGTAKQEPRTEAPGFLTSPS